MVRASWETGTPLTGWPLPAGPFRVATPAAANGEEGGNMPKMQPGDAEQALRRFGLGDEDVAAWHDSGLPEDAFTGWLTDRVARRPSGRRARQVYGAED